MIDAARKLVVARAVESRRRAILSQCWRSLCLNAAASELLRDRKCFREMMQQQQLQLVEQQQQLQLLSGGAGSLPALPLHDGLQDQQHEEQGGDSQWGSAALQRVFGALRSIT